MADIQFLDITPNMMVCPFRTQVTVGQHLTEEGIPEQYQLTMFPECQYKLCPYFNDNGKDNTEKCLRSII